MAKIPFNIKYRPQIESGEYKLKTFSGCPVTIYRWDFDNGGQTPIMGSYVFDDGKEYVGEWSEKGHADLMTPNDLDLFIITPEPEFTEFEQAVGELIKEAVHNEVGDNAVVYAVGRGWTDKLLELARKEIMDGWCRGLRDTQDFSGKAYNDGYQLGIENGKAEALKDLPRWKKVGVDTGQTNLIKGYKREEDELYRNGKCISLVSLEKLPGFKED